MPGSDIGKLLVIAGIFLVVFGLVFIFWQNIPFLGRLPGDIHIQKNGFSFFFPLATSLILSLILTILLNVIFRLFR
ncbi:MAG: DUF2905 domain-containing protein [Chloroflexi bacterium]|nr:DUF2905 domain-containing protein [Chloroflexota bacterium]